MLEQLGAPQIAALLILAQRGLEEIYSNRNTQRLLAEGAEEAGRDYYPVVAATHLGWIAALFFLISANAALNEILITLFILLQGVRYWVILSLGRFWTHRIITLKSARIVTRGPYTHLNHPNYAVTLIETGLLPMAFGAFALAVIMTTIWGAVLYYKIILEDAALKGRRNIESRI